MLTSNRIYNVILIMLLSAGFAWGISEHYYGLKDLGVIDSDEFFYWQTAKDWASGEITLTEHYRPLAYFMYSLGFKFFGATDYTHKLINFTFDLGTVLLAILFTRRFLSSWTIGAISGALYLLSPMATFYSRHGILHAPSAFFTLLHIFLLFYVLFGSHKKMLHYFLSGLALSAAANTHPDLIVLGLPSTLIFFLHKRYSDEPIKMVYSQLILFWLGCATLHIASFMYFGFAETVSCILAGQKVQKTQNAPNFFLHLFKIAYHYIRFNSSKFMVILMGITGVFTAYHYRKKHFWINQLFFLILFISGYLVLCKLLFGRTLIPRLYIPFLILSYIAVFGAMNELLKTMKFLVPAMTVIFLSLLYTVRTERYTPLFPTKHEVQSFPRVIHDQLKNKILNEKYLITPMTTYHIHQPLEKEVYLSGGGIYLALSPQASIKDAILENKIKYVLWSKRDWDPRIFGRNQREVIVGRLKRFYGLVPSDYTEEKEKSILLKILEDLKPKLIHSSNDVELYQLEGIQ